jgi:nitrite reductase/ring-hydroxylating ferredoxin subunit
MSIVDTLLKGRPNGIRARLRGMMGGGKAAPSASSAPKSGRVEAAEKSLSLRKEPPRDVTPPDGYEVVLHKDALDAGRIIEIIIGGTAIAVANVGGTHHAMANTCPHAGGPLGEGQLDDCVVTCPYHGWQFDVRDGTCRTQPGTAVKSYPVQIVGDAVCVQL